MANELLKFKKGLYANLPPKRSAGTIYVTTDEQAMYVDISDGLDGQRIRLGETVHFADLNAFQSFLNSTTPPYDTRAFYYIEKENALLKWVSDDTGNFQGKGTWKQINSTSDIEADLSTLEGEISTLKTTVSSNTTNIGKNSTEIGNIKTAIGAASDSSGSSLWAAINANKAAIESNDTDINNLDTNKLDKSTFDTFKTTNAEAIKAVDDKLGSSADTSNTSTAFQRIEALETSNATKASQADLEKLNETVYGSKDGTEANSGLVKKVANLETNSATKAALQEAIDDIAENSTAIADLRQDLGNTTDASTITTTAFGRIKKLEEAVGNGTSESLSGRVGKLETAIGDANSGLVKEVNYIKATIGSNGTDNKTGIYKEIADIKSKNSTQDTSIANLEKVLNGDTNGTDQNAKDGILKRLGAVEEKASTNSTAIGSKVDGTTGDTLWTAVKAAQDKGTTNANQIGTKGSGVTGSTLWEAVKNAQSSASTNSTNITNINNVIGTKPEGATTLWDAIKTNATDIDTLEQTIKNEINAANGMTYKGGVGSATEINGITKPKIGDTYVATQAFTFTQESKTVQVYAGDLLVASGTETNGVITAGLKWTLVNTGYIEAHESTLGVAAITNGAQINLNSYVSTLGGTPNTGDLGKVKITSDNLIITSSYNENTKTSEIKINEVWEAF